MIKAPAKINLALEVQGQRPDGYHDIHSIMQSVRLHDVLVLENRPIGLSVDCIPGNPVEQGAELYTGPETLVMPPSDKHNIVWKAAQLLMEATGISQGLHITIKKAVPLAAGLGGGSSDAAAVLRGLNEFWELGLSLDELIQIGRQVGADVPYCIVGGCAEVRGIGEVVAPLPPPSRWSVILINPPAAVSTASCYRAYDKLPYPVFVDVDRLKRALIDQDISETAESLGNSLEAVTLQKLPEVARLKQLLLDFGVLGALMSGSGPTLFGLARTKEHAEVVFSKLECKLKQEQQREMTKVYLTEFVGPEIFS
ncbi:MAG: 4-(cytidine 5'-diphospho)-2-C-methyl-D-erythritol kinase [Firmicutes bacterium]|nr:4-(cytidine 5'-diphospho)-2-C-methyl-D-erythritol kinase [Bacillota bacterium]